MSRTFASALVGDLRKQRGLVLEAIGVLNERIALALKEGKVAEAQGHCAQMFTLWPAVLTAEVGINVGLQVDLDDPTAAQTLINTLCVSALEQGSFTTQARSTGAIGMLAHQYQVESLAECARGVMEIKAQYEKRITKGEMPEAVLAALFEDEPEQAAPAEPDNVRRLHS